LIKKCISNATDADEEHNNEQVIQMTIEKCWMFPFFHFRRQNGPVLRAPSSVNDQRNYLSNSIQLALLLQNTLYELFLSNIAVIG